MRKPLGLSWIDVDVEAPEADQSIDPWLRMPEQRQRNHDAAPSATRIMTTSQTCCVAPRVSPV